MDLLKSISALRDSDRLISTTDTETICRTLTDLGCFNLADLISDYLSLGEPDDLSDKLERLDDLEGEIENGELVDVSCGDVCVFYGPDDLGQYLSSSDDWFDAHDVKSALSDFVHIWKKVRSQARERLGCIIFNSNDVDELTSRFHELLGDFE